MPITTGRWRIGKAGGAIVTDCPVVAGGKNIAECRWCSGGSHKFYGGHLICESLFSEDDALLIADAPAMRAILGALFMQIDPDEYAFPAGAETVLASLRATRVS